MESKNWGGKWRGSHIFLSSGWPSAGDALFASQFWFSSTFPLSLTFFLRPSLVSSTIRQKKGHFWTANESRNGKNRSRRKHRLKFEKFSPSPMKASPSFEVIYQSTSLLGSTDRNITTRRILKTDGNKQPWCSFLLSLRSTQNIDERNNMAGTMTTKRRI